MLYPELFKSLEQVRWNMETDIPWDKFDGTKLSDEQAQTIRMNAITEWSALPPKCSCATIAATAIFARSCPSGFSKNKNIRWY